MLLLPIVCSFPFALSVALPCSTFLPLLSKCKVSGSGAAAYLAIAELHSCWMLSMGIVEYRRRRYLSLCGCCFSPSRICRESPLTASSSCAIDALSRIEKPPDSNHGGTHYMMKGSHPNEGASSGRLDHL